MSDGSPPPVLRSRRHALLAGPEAAGQRVDQWIPTQLPQLSRSRVQALIEEGAVRVGDAPAKASQRLRAGERVVVEIAAPVPTALVPEAMALTVLHEDRHLLVLDKPAGIAVHPGAGVTSGTLVHGLLHKVADLQGIGGELRPGIVHRLDKDTSGCLVVAKTEPALRALQAAFKAREVEKRYLALVHGRPPAQGQFDTLFGRHPTDRKRFSSKVAEGKRAQSRFHTISAAADAALVEVELLTGRTHQIRVHFADAGHPLLGDKLYGGTRREARKDASPLVRKAAQLCGRQALHARSLTFVHPETGRRIACVAPVPPELKAALDLLELTVPA